LKQAAQTLAILPPDSRADFFMSAPDKTEKMSFANHTSFPQVPNIEQPDRAILGSIKNATRHNGYQWPL